MDELDRQIGLIETNLQARGHRAFTEHAEQEYRERQASLQENEKIVQEAEEVQERIRAKIGESAEEWRSAVDDMIGRVDERFRQLFESINCKGSVQLHVPTEDPLDFDKYELAIKVAFRTGEEPQLLGTRQSGGERSVSTMLYLLSFQGLSQAPFRLVDEINQGMDEEYERRTYTLIVQTATRLGNGQYFLISPKLLRGLEYSERMRILFVYNGPGVPETLQV